MILHLIFTRKGLKLKSIKEKTLSFLKIGEKGEDSCLKMKQKILRHCALSFTILLMSISGDKALKMKFKDGKDLIKKGLTNETELKLLGFYTSKGKVFFLRGEDNWVCFFVDSSFSAEQFFQHTTQE